jgi:hypothetical protein
MPHAFNRPGEDRPTLFCRDRAAKGTRKLRRRGCSPRQLELEERSTEIAKLISPMPAGVDRKPVTWLGFHGERSRPAGADQGSQSPYQKNNGGQAHRRHQPQHQIVKRHAPIPFVPSPGRISHRNLQTATSITHPGKKGQSPRVARWASRAKLLQKPPSNLHPLTFR